MNDSSGTVYVLHSVGRADLHLSPGDTCELKAREKAVRQALTEADPAHKRDILRLGTASGVPGGGEAADPVAAGQPRRPAPLESVLAALGPGASRVHLVLLTTKVVARIGESLRTALEEVPDAYGRAFDDIILVDCGEIVEPVAATHIQLKLAGLVDPSIDQALVVWGSGSTQLIFSALDAVTELLLPWRLAMISTGSGRVEPYDPTAGLPIDPVIPLLRRWRYHDLLLDMATNGELAVDGEQRRVLVDEAERWGHVFIRPTVTNMRALMAAALMRGDGSSGFAVREYVRQRYQALRAQQPGQVDLFREAGPRPTLGRVIKLARDSAEPAVVQARQTPAGQWLVSPVVSALNDMGAYGEHELRPPDRTSFHYLHRHLAELDGPEQPENRGTGLSALNLVPAQRVWYVAILGTADNDRQRTPILVQLAQAMQDQHRCSLVDPQVRRYLGLPDGQQPDTAFLVLGTRSGSCHLAAELAERLAADGFTARTAVIEDEPDRVASAQRPPFSADRAGCLLREHLGDDIAAMVVVPTGPKQLVLTLLAGGQRFAAQLGVPLYLRELVDAKKGVVDAGTHRLPLRFGTDRAVLSAALHALEIAELDTAARLLAAAGGAHRLARRAESLSLVLRCELSEPALWPAEYQGWSHPARTIGLLADRIEVWADLPAVDSPRPGDPAVATAVRAIIGARAVAEKSWKECFPTAGKHRLGELLGPGYRLRNELPVTHGRPLDSAEELLALVRTTGHESVSAMLTAMADRARQHFGAPRPGHAPALATLLAELRAEVRARRDAERARPGSRLQRRPAGSAASASVPPSRA